MKLFGYEIIRPRRVEEKYKAAYDKLGTSKPTRKTYHPGENTWASRCRHYDQLWDEYPLFKQACLSIAGLVTAQGVYFKPAVNKEEETYALAEEAVYRADKFKEKSKVTSKFYNTTLQIAKYGACFWEITDSPVFDFRVPTMQEYIEPYKVDDQGTVTDWRQIINGSVKAEWTNQDLVLLSWNPSTSTWPYGNGLGVGLETEMAALIEMETSARDYMDKQAWPYEVLALGDNDTNILESDYNNARNEWKNRKAGEGFAVRNMPVQLLPGGTGSSPIRELSTLCTLLKDNVHDGFIVPPLSKLYNSTEASAKVLTAHVMSVLGQPLQWLLKENFQDFVLKRYMESQGFSVKSSPITIFESPDVAKEAEGTFWKMLVDSKIQSPQQACDHLGLEYDEAFWKAEEQKQQMQFDKQLQAKKESTPFQKSEGVAPNDVEPKAKEGKSYKVTELYLEPHKHD